MIWCGLSKRGKSGRWLECIRCSCCFVEQAAMLILLITALIHLDLKPKDVQNSMPQSASVDANQRNTHFDADMITCRKESLLLDASFNLFDSITANQSLKLRIIFECLCLSELDLPINQSAYIILIFGPLHWCRRWRSWIDWFGRHCIYLMKLVAIVHTTKMRSLIMGEEAPFASIFPKHFRCHPNDICNISCHSSQPPKSLTEHLRLPPLHLHHTTIPLVKKTLERYRYHSSRFSP